MKTHELKILPQYFEDIVFGKKNFEIRKDDRGFSVGDKLVLKEWDNGEYSGRQVDRYVSYIHHGCGEFGISPDYCIMSLEKRCSDCISPFVRIAKSS